MLRRLAAALVLAGLLLTAAPAGAQPAEPAPSMLLVLDASGSMNGDDGTGRPKLAAAREALHRLIDALPEGAPVGVRVYGHRVPNTDKARGCTDTELVAPVAPLDRARLHGAVDAFGARGFTPIGLALRQGAADLPPGGERTIVLVSDGVDTCAPPEPCAVAAELAAAGVGLRIETVGFQVDAAARDQLRCIAEATGGAYRDAPDAAALAAGLERVASRAFRHYRVTGTPVTGGPTREAATVLPGPGRYRDRIFPGLRGPFLWYAVEVGPGQRLRATLTFVGRPESPRDRFGIMRSYLHDPDGHLVDEDLAEATGSGSGTAALAAAEPEAGVWFIRAGLANTERLLGDGYDLDLAVELDGGPAPAAAEPELPGRPQAIGVPDPVPGGGGGLGLLAAAVAAGVLAGAASGALLGRRLWRP